MFNRAVLVPLALLVFVFGLAGPGLADTAAQLDQAEQLQDQGQFEQAEAIYRAVAEANPGADDGLAAQEKLAVLYVEQDRQAEAQAAYQQLLSGYSQVDGIAKAVDHVGDAYREWGQYEEALDAYQDVIARWPDAQHAVGSQSWIARMYIQLGDEPNAAGAVEKLMRDFSDHDALGTAVHDVAYTYHHTARQYDEARKLYEWVVANRPDDSQAIRAQMGIAKVYIVRGDDPNAQAAIDKLIADYSHDQEGIAKALDHIGDKYRKVGQYEKARDIYELVVTQWANTKYAENSRMGLAKAIIEAQIADRDDEAVEAEIESLVADFNDHEGLAKALFQLG
ncbi:MAG: tetratricopeptide repeat protein, partial [Planctomycetota bacterium]